jgi:hypothetical protein
MPKTPRCPKPSFLVFPRFSKTPRNPSVSSFRRLLPRLARQSDWRQIAEFRLFAIPAVRIHLEGALRLAWGRAEGFGSLRGRAGSFSKSIGNAFTVSQAWDGNTLYLYQAYLAQKAFDDQLEIGIGRVSATQFFATLPAFDLLLNGGLNSVPIALKLNSTFTGSSSASWFAGKGGKNS